MAPKNILKPEQIVGGLSHVAKTHDGASYAYTNLVLEEKELEELGEALRNYQHLRFLSVSKNQLKDVSEILHLPFLLTFQSAENQVASIDFLSTARDQLQYLQHLILTKNKLTALPAIPLPRLSRLLLNENEIANCAAFEGHATLLHLDLSKNKLNSTAGLANMPQLQVLDLTENEVADISVGLTKMSSLRKLILTKNKVTSLDKFPRLPALQHLVLTENQLADLKQLDHLSTTTTLKQLDMQENPITTEKGDAFKLEVLIRLNETNGLLRRLNDEEVTDEDVTNA